MLKNKIASNLIDEPEMTFSEQSLDELKGLFAILYSDVEEANINFKKSSNDGGYAARVLYRAFFALIEGMSYRFRSAALSFQNEHPGYFLPDEELSLKEKVPSLNEKGEVILKDTYHKLLPAMLFGIRVYSRLHGGKYKADTSKHDWNSMIKFVKIRNDIAHPKKCQDIEITPEKVRIAEQAADWYNREVGKLFKDCELQDEKYFKLGRDFGLSVGYENYTRSGDQRQVEFLNNLKCDESTAYSPYEIDTFLHLLRIQRLKSS
jgi:hypothetical protein